MSSNCVFHAQVYSALGMHKEAMSDMTKAITIKPTAKLYAHRATVYFRDEVSTRVRPAVYLFNS